MSDNLTVDSLSEIIQSLRDGVAIYWKDIGLYLGVPMETLTIIEQDNPPGPNSTRDKQRSMLHYWLKNCTSRTWTKLIKAVESVSGGQNLALAEKIKNERLDPCHSENR